MSTFERLPLRIRHWILDRLVSKYPSFSLEWTVGRRNRKHDDWTPLREAAARGPMRESLVPPREFDALLPWIFHHGMSSRGICQLDIDEALALWKLCREGPARTAVEIGRFKGGSTFLLACAIGEGGRLISFDLDNQYDAELSTVLRATGLDGRVELIVGDSQSSGLSRTTVADLVFVDGGHSREAVMADVRTWYPALKHGGVMCFHDAVQTRSNATAIPSVVDTVQELSTSPEYDWVRIVEAGSLLAFRKHAGRAQTQ